MNGWEADKKWSDRFLTDIKQILGVHLIDEPPIEEDAQRNTDLTVLRMAEIRVGCRVRKRYYYDRWPNQFTIRSDRPSGTKTELAKIIEGWGRFLFYGFSDEVEAGLIWWSLIDLNVFRYWWSTQLIKQHGEMPGMLRENHDNSSAFRAFDIEGMPAEMVYARGGSIRDM